MDVVVHARRCEVSERFREHATAKVGKIGKFDHKVLRVDVEVSRERNPRLSDLAHRVELTCRSRGPVVRAEAAAGDPFAALDAALDKLEGRLRRVADRRRVHHGHRSPTSVAVATGGAAGSGEAAGASAPEVAAEAPPEVSPERAAAGVVAADGPFVVREKVHDAAPMTLDQALHEMELVGHDFFLFIDSDSGQPAVVYRRRGYDYGVIRLRVVTGDEAGVEEAG